MQVTEAAVLDALKVVTDPDLHRDIVALGFIKNLKVDRTEFDATMNYIFRNAVEAYANGTDARDQLKRVERLR